MSGLESLDELANDVNDAYEDAIQLAEANHDYASPTAIRDIDGAEGEEEEASGNVSKVEMLESWTQLIRVLYDHQIFLQYSPLLEKIFCQEIPESKYGASKILTDLMADAVEHGHDQQPASECRYVTLMEILASFTDHWQISHQCESIWASVADMDVSVESSGAEFRRNAYDVLMGLSWVPNAPGLRDVCGFEEAGSGAQEVPAVVGSIFYQIRSTPLPRHDFIHRLLNRLETGAASVTLAIASPDDSFSSRSASSAGKGLGKTTLAAMVTAHPAVQNHYCVLWLRLDRKDFGSKNSMTFKQYTKYLDSLCEQLGVQPSWPQPIRSLEERSLREKREEEKMFQIKREMSRILEEKAAKGVLLVLDDVNDDQEIEWFWFLSHQSMLVTTLSQTLSVDWTLELEMLSEDEALQLFLTEADYPPAHVLSTSLEAKSIVHRCGYHPLTIRTVARWFRLKQVTAGVVKGLEELNHELSSCTAKLKHSRSSVNPSKVLFEVMNLMLSPVFSAGGQPTTLMKMSLSSMAIVFPYKVPSEAVFLLWGQLLRTEPDAIHELGDDLTQSQLKKRVRFISEALSSLGLLTHTEKNGISYLEVHHEMQIDYAIDLCREMQFSDKTSITVRRWHEAFATAYLAKKVNCDRDGLEDKCRGYALEKLLYHMLKAGMYQEVAVLLRDEGFLGERLDSMGAERGTLLHIDDCKRLQKAMKDDQKINADPADVAADVYIKVGAFVADYANEVSEENLEDSAQAIYLVGFSLAEIGRYSEAASQYKIALKMVEKTSSLAGTILHGLSTVYLCRHDYEKGLKNLKECLKVMSEGGETNVLYSEALMLKGDALMNDCDYSGAMEFYDFALEKLFTHSANNRVEIGIAFGRKGRLYQVMGELDNAFKAFDECLKWKEKIEESSCDLASVYSFMGDICATKGETEEALQYFERALRMQEANKMDAAISDIYILGAKIKELNRDFDRCQDDLLRALENLIESKEGVMDRKSYDLRMVARIYENIGDDSRAEKVYSDCLKATNSRQEDSLERSLTLFDMGNLHLKQQKTDLALQKFQQSLKIQISKLGESPAIIKTLLKIGKLHRTEGKLDEAHSFVHKALEVTERVFGENDDRVPDVLFAVADIKMELNENVEALAMFGECLDMRKRQHSRPHADTAEVLEGLAKVQMKNASYDVAYQYLVEALSIRQETSEPDNPGIANTFHLIGMAARKGGDCERALHFLLDALHIRKTMVDQRDTVATLTEIGHLHRQLGDDDSALGCYEKCLEILLETYGPKCALLVDMYLSLGHVKMRQKIMDEAKECYESALKISKSVLGDDSAKTGAPFRSLGLLQFEKGNYEESLEYLETFVRIQDSHKMRNTVDYVLALLLIGVIYSHLGRKDKASSAFASANHAFSGSKEVAKKYPSFGPILAKRLAAEESKSDTAATGGFFARLTVSLVEEVQPGGNGIVCDDDENQLRGSIILDD